ncbi:MAG: exonuclease SbcCD subunit D [Leptolyngbyaceae cyanobacterium MO_188.B28]|nr:exonuclease SbcCD subunit D [Leptolyngbyaceae cyanobacterium MO_188.B28]
MARFLHLADIHLGFDRYDNKERTKDFFRAFQDVLERYAIAAQADFVLIVGDLFEHRNIQPAILNQAQICLQMLKDAEIPVLAIEGNHDNRPYGVKTSWLRYLSDWGLLKLLEPGDISAGEPFYSPWDEEWRRGGYVDLDCGVRVVGANWYGAAAPRAIEQIAAGIQALPASSNPVALMFHHGIEGQISRYVGALRYRELLPLKQAGVDYLALGHIHKSYTVEDWIFNPGSLEANNVEESQYDRGVYLVDIDRNGIHAELKQDYYQRPIIRLQLSARGQESIEDIEQGAHQTLEQAVQSGQLNPRQAPIVELRIEGQVGFDRLELDTRQLQQTLQQQSGALIFLLRYNVDQVAYGSQLTEDASRIQIEQDVFTDLLAANNVYKKRADALATGLIELKDMQLDGQTEETLYQFIQTLLQVER